MIKNDPEIFSVWIFTFLMCMYTTSPRTFGRFGSSTFKLRRRSSSNEDWWEEVGSGALCTFQMLNEFYLGDKLDEGY